MRSLVLFIAIAVLFSPCLLSAQSLPGDKGNYSISPLRTLQLKSTNYLYATTETTYADMGTFIGAVMTQLTESVQSHAFLPTGGPIYVYKGIQPQQNKAFTLQVGYPVGPEVQSPVGGFQLGKVESHRSAVAVYIGRIDGLGEVYGKLYNQIALAGLSAADERREHFIFYDGQNSNTNVILIEILLK